MYPACVDARMRGMARDFGTVQDFAAEDPGSPGGCLAGVADVRGKRNALYVPQFTWKAPEVGAAAT